MGERWADSPVGVVGESAQVDLKSKQRFKLKGGNVPFHRRITGTGFLLALAAIAIVGGWGGRAVALTQQEEQELDAAFEKEFAAKLKKAEAGEADAQAFVALQYQWRLTIRNPAKAMEWNEKAALQGHAGAQARLGRIYLNGWWGTKKDLTKALMWFQKAAAQGDDDAQQELGSMYANGVGVPKNAAKAFEWYQKAADQGNELAQEEVGTRYYSGDGVKKDKVKARIWWQKAADETRKYPNGTRRSWGNAYAQYSLGLLYQHGEGVPKDEARAFELYKKAAVNGLSPVPAAQLELGRMYLSGSGVSKDYVLGYAWINIAASSGDRETVGFRDTIEKYLSVAEKAEAQRISSKWRKSSHAYGETLVRERGAATPDTPSVRHTKRGTGTAFLVSTAGHAITNHHVIDGCREVKAEGREGVVKVVTSDTVNDLALLQIPGATNATANVVSDPAKLRQGEDIVAFGFPLNSVLSSGGNLTPGVVSALTGLGNNTNQIQITAPIQPGSSGSPVLNKKGEVVGVVSMKLSDSKMAKATGQIAQNVNFAVSGQTLKAFLDAHKVTYSTGGFFSRDKSTADLADEARKWTLVVECWK